MGGGIDQLFQAVADGTDLPIDQVCYYKKAAGAIKRLVTSCFNTQITNVCM